MLGIQRSSFIGALASYWAGGAPAGRTAVTVTANGDAQISGTQSKFGSGSAYFDANNDWLSVEAIDDSATDLTYEAWVRYDINPESQTLGGGSYMMLATVAPNTYISCQEIGGVKAVSLADSGTYMSFTEVGGSGWNTNQWYHVAVVRNADQYDAYVDGVALTRPATSTKAGGFISNATHIIGRFIDTRGSWGGYIDELRISNTARYTTNFTPDATQFTNDANTLLLLHLDTDFSDDAT